MGKLILLTGGARSGKSTMAVRLADERGGRVAFVATMVSRDEEMTERIKLHRESRPPEWETHVAEQEVAPLLKRLAGQADVVIVDCITLLVSNCLLAGLAEDEVLERVEALADAADAGDFLVIAVTNEVGMGVVPTSALGRKFRDVAGRANQILARRAAEVHMLVSGLPVKLKGED